MPNKNNAFGGFIHTSLLCTSPPDHDPHQGLVSNIIRDYFGPTVQLVADGLVLRGSCTVPQIVSLVQRTVTNNRSNKLERRVILDAMLVLYHHNLVTLKAQKDVYSYSLDGDRVRCILYYPMYLDFVKRLFPGSGGGTNYAQCILEELLVHGRMTASDVMVKSMAAVEREEEQDEEEGDEENASKLNEEEVRQGLFKTFVKLVEGGYLHKDTPVPAFNNKSEDEGENEMAFDKDSANPISVKSNNETHDNAKSSSDEEDPDVSDPAIATLLSKYNRLIPPGSVWRINIPMLHATTRSYSLGRLISERYGDKVQAAGSIITAALKYSAHCDHSPIATFKETDKDLLDIKGIFSPDDIMDFLPPQVLTAFKTRTGGARNHLSSSLVALSRFTWPPCVVEIEEAEGNPLGGKFEIYTRQIVQHLQGRVMHRVIAHRFGDVAARICSILQTRGYLEADTIAESAMVPVKDVRELLHKLYKANYISLFNMQQSKAHNAATAVYLFHVNPMRLLQCITDNVCTALLNLRLRRQHEMDVGKDWIERAKEAGATDENDHELDKLNYAKFCQGLERLDAAILQLVETLMVLKDF